MLEKLTFTLYEVFGYLLPGNVTLVGFMLLYWALFVPRVPLGVVSFQPDLVGWSAIVVTSYLLGHAAQAMGNLTLRKIEESALAMKRASWMSERATQTAAGLLGVPAEKIEPRWVYRALDEYAVQSGQAGDRDMFVYREGFYRATSIALFFLSLTLLIRMVVPGASIQFAKWLFPVSCWQSFTTAVIAGLVGWLFLQRYRRFADYRVTRAVLSALVIQKETRLREPDAKSPSTPK